MGRPCTSSPRAAARETPAFPPVPAQQDGEEAESAADGERDAPAEGLDLRRREGEMHRQRQQHAKDGAHGDARHHDAERSAPPRLRHMLGPEQVAAGHFPADGEALRDAQQAEQHGRGRAPHCP